MGVRGGRVGRIYNYLKNSPGLLRSAKALYCCRYQRHGKRALFLRRILPRKTSLGGAEGGTCSATSSLAARTRAKRNLHGVGGRRRLVRGRAAAERVCVIGVAEASSDAAALGLQLAGGITHQARIVGGGNAIRTKERAQES